MFSVYILLFSFDLIAKRDRWWSVEIPEFLRINKAKNNITDKIVSLCSYSIIYYYTILYYELCATWKFQIERKYDLDSRVLSIVYYFFVLFLRPLHYTKCVVKVNELFDEYIRSNIDDLL